jgi:nucleoside-diphosphate-sugar epimerase
MEDAVNATIKLMEAPAEKISVRSSYNVGGISFTPKQIYEQIKQRLPDFKISYNPDFRQPIAESWPQSIDDSQAQKDWGLETKYDINKLTDVMLEGVRKKFKSEC